MDKLITHLDCSFLYTVRRMYEMRRAAGVSLWRRESNWWSLPSLRATESERERAYRVCWIIDMTRWQSPAGDTAFCRWHICRPYALIHRADMQMSTVISNKPLWTLRDCASGQWSSLCHQHSTLSPSLWRVLLARCCCCCYCLPPGVCVWVLTDW